MAIRKINFAIQEESVAQLDDLCKRTFRSRSDLIEWLVAEKFEKLTSKRVVMAGHNDIAVVDPEWIAQS